MTYRITRADDLAHEAVTHFDWWTISAGDISAEANAAGLSCQPPDGELLVLRRLD